jgi:hypothetical protein
VLDIRIHAATVHATLNNPARALAELAAIEKIAPKAMEREDVKALRARLEQP